MDRRFTLFAALALPLFSAACAGAASSGAAGADGCARAMHDEGGVCVADAANTAAPNAEPVAVAHARNAPAPSPDCGVGGRHDLMGGCIPAPQPESPPDFLVRTSARQIVGDGYGPVNVVAFALKDADVGTLVQLHLTRRAAGALTDAPIIIGPVGGDVDFTPCDARVQPSCVGPFRIVMTLLEDPSVVLATSAELEIVAPPEAAPPPRGK